MSDEIVVFLIGFATVAVTGLAISFLLTALRRKRSKCPQCGARTPAAGATYIDEISSQKMRGEADIPLAFISALSRIDIGIVVIVYVFTLLVNALGYETCGLQGISMVCTDEAAGRADLSVNLIYSLLGIVGGVIVIFNGLTQFLRAFKSRGKNMTYEYICTRDHRWTEQQ